MRLYRSAVHSDSRRERWVVAVWLAIGVAALVAELLRPTCYRPPPAPVPAGATTP